MQKSRFRAVAALGATALAAAGAVAVGTAPVQAAGYAPADTAKIHPGTMMYTDGAQCTANFVFSDGAGNTYVGYAAHCAGQGEATDTNGCDTTSLPLGTKVTFVPSGREFVSQPLVSVASPWPAQCAAYPT